MRALPGPKARLAMQLQWRAGLRVSEAVNVTRSDVHVEAKTPELKVRQGKGSKDRLVPLHIDLAGSLSNFIGMSHQRAGEPLIDVTRQIAWRWYKEALNKCYENGSIAVGKPCATHTLRHSAARYWLMNSVPINVVSQWLGHANLSQTMIYLQLVSDPGGFMERVP